MSYTVYGPDARRLLERLERLESAKTNTWTSVSDMLPEPEKPVLVWTGAGIYVAVIGPSFNSSACWESCESGGGISGVTHWQPLPKPPDKEER